jgi:hypothetical protein
LKNRESQFAMMASRARDAGAFFENGNEKMIDLDKPAFPRIPQEVRRESWRGQCC